MGPQDAAGFGVEPALTAAAHLCGHLGQEVAGQRLPRAPGLVPGATGSDQSQALPPPQHLVPIRGLIDVSQARTFQRELAAS